MRCYRLAVETSIERRVREQITIAELPFTQEAQIGPWIVDFLIGDRLVIEADGSYWHTKRPHVDQRKTDDLQARGYIVWRLAEPYILRADFPGRFGVRIARAQAASLI